ncbi:hypothetical protein [Moorena producens]|uniref:hypothetical protein n=1 Tax=Moorena producens TaxID=1155739 RepID=UPI003C77FD96
MSAYFLVVFLDHPVSSTALQSGTSAIAIIYHDLIDTGRLGDNLINCHKPLLPTPYSLLPLLNDSIHR